MKKVGIILLLIGIGIFMLFGGAGFIAFLFDPGVPIIIKIAVLSVAVGILLVVVAVIKENWGKKDKYEEVKR